MDTRNGRRSIRLPEFNYSWPGYYFVTISTYMKEPIFGEVKNLEIMLNTLGQIAESVWQDLPLHFHNVELDAFIVMPDHVHGIIVIKDGSAGESGDAKENLRGSVRATHESPLPIAKSPLRLAKRARGPKQGSLGAIIGMYKAAVSKEIHRLTPGANGRIWHRNYYEHIIRDDQDLENIRRYILHNAAK